MWNVVIGAIVGGVAGGMIQGISAYRNTNKQIDAYQQAADSIKEANEKYSGQNATNNENEQARQTALSNALWDSGKQAMRGNNNIDASDSYMNGYSLGMGNAKAMNQARYNAATADAQRILDKDLRGAKAEQQMVQAGLNTAGGLTDLYKNLKSNNMKDEEPGSDENLKLPPSDIEDSLRQINTIQYKYKDPEYPGCDDEVHDSGFTAQSLEQTPLGKDVVDTDSNGYKKVDEWKLMEALTAGIAQLQKEIDEISNNKERDNEKS